MSAPHRVLVVTGMSGSGKSTAARALEDAGWWCIDNLPAPLIPKVAELGVEQPQLAFVLDVREGQYLANAPAALDALRTAGHSVEVVFFDATDDTLVRRYSETRRRHPLAGNDSIAVGIARERLALAPLLRQAEHIIDTTGLSSHALRRDISNRFATGAERKMALTLMSFGFKYGVPLNADLIFDVRFLPNPYFVPGLRELTGRDLPVANFVLGVPDAQTFVAKVVDLMHFLLPLYQRESKTYLTVAIGCTGGKHRSVTIIRELAKELATRAHGEGLQLWDRDIEKDVEVHSDAAVAHPDG